ncbi:MAG: hypothetical protein CMJ83_00175 [Planctomycetes bacterium]|nr:hypothetical protein [Planctomycetota bacterium]
MGVVDRRVLILMFVVLLAGSRAEAQEKPSGRALYDKIYRATAEVLVDGRQNGSACFVGSKGLVLTAAHLFKTKPGLIELSTNVGGRVRAELLAIDRGHDVALIEVEQRDGGWPGLELAETEPEPCRDVFLLGAPLYRHAVLIRGAFGRPLPSYEYYGSDQLYISMIHVSATVQSGTSGVAWVDAHGRIFGVQSGTMTEKGVPVGLAFVAPLVPIKRIVGDQTSATTATVGLGVESVWEQKEDFVKKLAEGMEGLVVRKIRAKGGGARAGIKEWDVILSIDGKPVRRVGDLLSRVRAGKPGDELTLEILKPDAKRKVKRKVKLRRLEEPWVYEL